MYNPQSLNRYTYTLNNPVKYTDPSGHDPNPPITPDQPWWKYLYPERNITYDREAAIEYATDSDVLAAEYYSLDDIKEERPEGTPVIYYPEAACTEFVNNILAAGGWTPDPLNESLLETYEVGYNKSYYTPYYNADDFVHFMKNQKSGVLVEEFDDISGSTQDIIDSLINNVSAGDIIVIHQYEQIAGIDYSHAIFVTSVDIVNNDIEFVEMSGKYEGEGKAGENTTRWLSEVDGINTRIAIIKLASK